MISKKSEEGGKTCCKCQIIWWSVCLSVTIFDLNYLVIGFAEWAEFLGTFFLKVGPNWSFNSIKCKEQNIHFINL